MVFVMNVLAVRPGATDSNATDTTADAVAVATASIAVATTVANNAAAVAAFSDGATPFWDESQMAVKRHLDITGAICSAAHSFVAHQVRASYGCGYGCGMGVLAYSRHGEGPYLPASTVPFAPPPMLTSPTRWLFK